MKISPVLVIVLGLLTLSTNTFSQSSDLAPGYYVVVGAYAKSREAIAKNYADALKQKGTDASYGFNAGRNLYFVYLKRYTTLKESLKDMVKVRSQAEFKDAWVRVVPGVVEENPVATTTTTQQVTTTESELALVPAAKPDPAKTDSEVIPSAESIEVTDNDEIVQYSQMTLGNTEVFLSLYNAANNRIVEGEVQVIDKERARQITRVKGNEYLILPNPKSKSGQLTLICEAFGYKKVQQEINYSLPLADTVKPNIDLMGTTMVINFHLERYRKGDIGTLYNVYFYNDAALMLPESNYEVSSLLHMMQENNRYKIRLHGHTNGNYRGKLITLGPDKKFFSLEGAKEGTGSAKDLSFYRAEVIKEYLIAGGIAPDRIETKAWGGKRPLYDRRSATAKKNVRVEVEILEE